MTDKWSDIPRGPNPSLNSVKRADPAHPLPFYRGRDFQGQYLFTLEGNAGRERIGKPLPLAGIEFSIDEPEKGRCRIVLTLADPSQLDVFQALCSNLMAATSQFDPSETEAGMLGVIGRLNRWHELLKRRHDNLLTRQEIIGIIGELLFLRDVVVPQMGGNDAVNAWCGTYRDEQDFVIGPTIVEVKTQTASADRKVHISSEDQLDTTSGPILLVCQLLATSDAQRPKSFTLNSLVAEIDDHLAALDLTAQDAFRAALIAGCYIEREEYNSVFWIMTDRTAFDVGEGFPRIVAGDLLPGVERVKYLIKFDALAKFGISQGQLMERLFSGRS